MTYHRNKCNKCFKFTKSNIVTCFSCEEKAERTFGKERDCIKCNNPFRSRKFLSICDTCTLGVLAFNPGIFPFLDLIEKEGVDSMYFKESISRLSSAQMRP